MHDSERMGFEGDFQLEIVLLGEQCQGFWIADLAK